MCTKLFYACGGYIFYTATSSVNQTADKVLLLFISGKWLIVGKITNRYNFFLCKINIEFYQVLIVIKLK